MDQLQENDVLAFLAAGITSVWSLELLIAMRRAPDRSWQVAELVRELRASTRVVEQSLANLEAMGLAAAGENGSFCYRAASPELDAYAEAATALYRTKPVAVINAIIRAANDKLKIFAEAFRIKDQ